MTNKRSAQIIAILNEKKTKINSDTENNDSQTDENDDSKFTKRDDRFKNFIASNVIVSVRDSMFAKVQSKKLSKQIAITKILVFMKNFITTNHDQVVFLNNHSKKSIMTFYRKSEKFEFMIHLWTNFVRFVQFFRDQIELNVFASDVTIVELKIINIQIMSNVFSEMITVKDVFRFKDNYEVSIINAQRFSMNVFFKNTVIATNIDILRSRAFFMKKKTFVLNKQIRKYETIADALKTAMKKEKSIDDDELNNFFENESSLIQMEMFYIEKSLTLNRKKFNRYIKNHENHLFVIAMRLRSEMTNLILFVHRVDKKLRDVIQLKMTTDFKLLRDIKQFGKYEIATWQMIVLLTKAHMCICAICEIITTGNFSAFAQYKYFKNKLSQLRRENAFSSLKSQHSHSFAVENFFRQSFINFDNEDDDDLDSDNETEFVIANVSNKDVISANINIAESDVVAIQDDVSVSKKVELIVATTVNEHVLENDSASEEIIVVVQDDGSISKEVESLIAIFLNEDVVEKKAVTEGIVIDVQDENLIDNEVDSVIATFFVEKNADVNSQQSAF